MNEDSRGELPLSSRTNNSSGVVVTAPPSKTRVQDSVHSNNLQLISREGVGKRKYDEAFSTVDATANAAAAVGVSSSAILPVTSTSALPVMSTSTPDCVAGKSALAHEASALRTARKDFTINDHSYPETIRYRVLVLFSGPECTDGGIDTYLKGMGIDEVIMVDILNDMKFPQDLSADQCWEFWLAIFAYILIYFSETCMR